VFLLQRTSVFVERAAKIGLNFFPPNFSDFFSKIIRFPICRGGKEQRLFSKAGCKDNPGFCSAKSFSKLIVHKPLKSAASKAFRNEKKLLIPRLYQTSSAAKGSG
jgi:hypothetical protein